jgi:acrylyl-CoA reductase (NADPH)
MVPSMPAAPAVPSAPFRAFRAVTTGDAVDRGVVTMNVDELPEDGALVEVHWSSVNYKDGLAATPTGKVARISPMVPGVDLAGVLLEDAGDLAAGTEVIAHGYDLGVARHGGFAAYARVPAGWLVALPAGLTTRDAMVIGTAGFTAAMSVAALADHGITPAAGPVLVTGATGGVGSTAVGMLAGLGYDVVASTGKPDAASFLTSIGASSIVDRAELAEVGKRPLESMVWAGAVDCVGGTTLANVLKRINYGGAVAASGLTGGNDLPTTVLPFILRGVSLLGIDSVQTPIERRRAVWARLATDLRPAKLDEIGHTIGLDELDGVLTDILNGSMTGRAVVDVRA